MLRRRNTQPALLPPQARPPIGHFGAGTCSCPSGTRQTPSGLSQVRSRALPARPDAWAAVHATDGATLTRGQPAAEPLTTDRLFLRPWGADSLVSTGCTTRQGGEAIQPRGTLAANCVRFACTPNRAAPRSFAPVALGRRPFSTCDGNGCSPALRGGGCAVGLMAQCPSVSGPQARAKASHAAARFGGRSGQSGVPCSGKREGWTALFNGHPGQATSTAQGYLGQRFNDRPAAGESPPHEIIPAGTNRPPMAPDARTRPCPATRRTSPSATPDSRSSSQPRTDLGHSTVPLGRPFENYRRGVQQLTRLGKPQGPRSRSGGLQVRTSNRSPGTRRDSPSAH